MKDLLTVEEFSKATGMAIGSIYHLVKNKEVKHYRIGRRIFLKLDDFIVENEREDSNE